LDLDGHRAPPGLPLQGGDQPLVRQQRRVDPPSQVPEVLQGLGHLGFGLLEQVVRLAGILRPELACQADLHREGHELLLGPVVDVALQAPAFLILGGDDALP